MFVSLRGSQNRSPKAARSSLWPLRPPFHDSKLDRHEFYTAYLGSLRTCAYDKVLRGKGTWQRLLVVFDWHAATCSSCSLQENSLHPAEQLTRKCASGPLASSMVYPSYTIVACVEACLSAYVGPDDSTHLATTVTANTAVVILRHGSPYAS